jgi:hypothetical protein
MWIAIVVGGAVALMVVLDLVGVVSFIGWSTRKK